MRFLTRDDVGKTFITRSNEHVKVVSYATSSLTTYPVTISSVRTGYTYTTNKYGQMYGPKEESGYDIIDELNKVTDSDVNDIFDLKATSKLWKESNVVKKSPTVVTPKEEEKTMSMKNILGPVGRLNNSSVKLSISGLAVKGDGGSYFGFNGSEAVDVSDMVMDGGIIFQMPSNTAEPGDLIVTRGSGAAFLFIKEVNDDGTFVGLNPNTNKIETFAPPTNAFFKTKFFTKIVSPMSVGPDSDMSDLAPFFMFGGDGGGDKKDMMMMAMMMSQKGDKKFNPMMFAFMGDDKDSKGGMMEAMMMASMFSGDGDNPFANMFGGGKKPAKTTKKAK